MLGVERKTFYFDRPGPVNTRKTLELARDRAVESGLKMVISSQTGNSLRMALEVCKGSGIEIMGVTRPVGNVHSVKRIEQFGTYYEIPELEEQLAKWKQEGRNEVINHISVEDEAEFRRQGIRIARGDNAIRSAYTQPLNLRLGLTQDIKIENVDDVILYSLGIYGSALGTVIKIAMRVVEAGLADPKNELVVCGGTERGLDHAIVAKPSTAAKMFDEREGFEVREIICKPRALVGKSGYLLQRRVG
jgi:hypothetical protein